MSPFGLSLPVVVVDSFHFYRIGVNYGPVTLSSEYQNLGINGFFKSRKAAVVVNSTSGEKLVIDSFTLERLVRNLGEVDAAPEGVIFGEGSFSIDATIDNRRNISISGVPTMGQIWPRGNAGMPSVFPDLSVQLPEVVNTAVDHPFDINLSNSSILENVPIGTVIGTFSTFSNVGYGSTYHYELVSGLGATDNVNFHISGNSLITDVMFTFSIKSSYLIRIRTTSLSGFFTEKQIVLVIQQVIG